MNSYIVLEPRKKEKRLEKAAKVIEGKTKERTSKITLLLSSKELEKH